MQTSFTTKDNALSSNKGNLSTEEKTRAFTKSDVERLIKENTSLKDYSEWFSIHFFTHSLQLIILDCTNENVRLTARFYQTEDYLFGTRTHWIVDDIDRDNVEMLANTVQDLESVATLLQYEGIRFKDILVEETKPVSLPQ